MAEKKLDIIEERTKTINALKKFKKEFSGGFIRVFGDDNLQSLNEYAKSSVSGLLTPVRNKVTSITNDILSDTGLRSVVDAVTVIVADIIEDITKDEGVQDLLDNANPVIDQLSIDVSNVIDWIADIFLIWAKWLGNVPDAPTPDEAIKDLFEMIAEFFAGWTWWDWVQFIGSLFGIQPPNDNLPPNFVIPTPPDVLFPPFDPDDPDLLIPGDGGGGGGFGWH